MSEPEYGGLQPQIAGEAFTDRVLSELADRDPDYVFAEVSGGHDSTAMLYAAHESDELEIDAVVHINTGIGVRETRRYVQEQCARLGYSYIEGIQPKMERRYAARVIEHGFPGSNPIAHDIHRIDGKQDVEDQLVQGFDGEVVILTGVSRYESQRRKKTVSQSGIQEDNRHSHVVYGGPIAEYTGSDINDVLRRHGVERNPAADVLDSSGECLCGSFAVFWDLEYLWQLEPELVFAIWNLMLLARQHWIQYVEEHGEPPYPRQYLIWGHGGLGRGALSEMVVGDLDDPEDFRDSDAEQRADRADRDDEQADLSNKCSSCEQPVATDGGTCSFQPDAGEERCCVDTANDRSRGDR
jgi:3'-phosphoadenosine 5'-phosphosulfate sulfotransferase (PAPS reductase)/FAD synthetase